MVTILDDDTTLKDFQSILSKHPLCAVVSAASFSSPCKVLLDDLKKIKSEDGCCGSSSFYEIFILFTDLSDEMEDLAIELGLDGIPSFQIYKNGLLQPGYKDIDERKITAELIQQALVDEAATTTTAASTNGCCPPSTTTNNGGGISPVVACCSPKEEQPIDATDILKLVQESYTKTVNQNPEGCCVSVDPNLNAYDMKEMIQAGATDANLGLGCGNPLTFSNIKEGETVVDLGSGAGVDCFLASVKVGASGMVIGVDMTPDMLSAARGNAKKRLLSDESSRHHHHPHIHDNVQFRLGEIEYLPIADSTVDCVISNCVINLSPNKGQVFHEIYRILKPGGRIAISDVVNRPQIEIPNRLKTAEALAC